MLECLAGFSSSPSRQPPPWPADGLTDRRFSLLVLPLAPVTVGTVKIDDTPCFVEFHGDRRTFLDTTRLDFNLLQRKNLLPLRGLELDLFLHLAHIDQISGHTAMCALG